jgi:copper chaperone CopZ
MKNTLILSLAVLTLASLANAAETKVTLTGVHNCCKGCDNGITGAAKDLKDVTVTTDGETVTIVAKKAGDAKKAVEAIYAAGYYGTSDFKEEAPRSGLPPRPAPEKADKKLTAATVTGAHLCCGKCVKAVTAAVETVPGVTKSNIVAKEKTFTVEGDFSEKALLTALNKAGFQGSIQ